MSKDFVWGRDASGIDRRVGVRSVGGGQYGLILANDADAGTVKPSFIGPGVAGFSAVTTGRGMYEAALDDDDASLRAVFEPLVPGTYKCVIAFHCDEVPTGNTLGLTAVVDVMSEGDDPTAALATAEDLDPDMTGADDVLTFVETATVEVTEDDIVTVEVAKNEDDGASGNLVIHGIKLVRV